MQARSATNINGMDVSHHQGNIDWIKVAKDKQNIKFALIKATEGITGLDNQFRRNAVGAPAVSLKVGFYHYCRPENGNTAVQEAENFITAVLGLKCDLPHVLDVEGDANKLGREKLTEWCYQWLDIVRKRTGHKVMLYSGGSFAKDYLGSKLGEFPLWIAHYGAVTPMANNTWSKWAVFQYGSNGRVDGISTGNVDMNVMELSYWNELFPPIVKPVVTPSPAMDLVAQAMKVIVSENGVADPQYWLDCCSGKKQVSPANLSSFVKNMARIINRYQGGV